MERFKPFRALAECYAHALLSEREAIARYQEFAEISRHQGGEADAHLFRELAESHTRRIAALARQAEGLDLPRLNPRQHDWPDDRRPDTYPKGMNPHPSSPRDTLGIALAAEKRAMAFFELVAWQAEHRDAKRLAARIVKEQLKYIARLKRASRDAPSHFTPESCVASFANGPG